MKTAFVLVEKLCLVKLFPASATTLIRRVCYLFYLTRMELCVTNFSQLFTSCGYCFFQIRHYAIHCPIGVLAVSLGTIAVCPAIDAIELHDPPLTADATFGIAITGWDHGQNVQLAARNFRIGYHPFSGYG